MCTCIPALSQLCAVQTKVMQTPLVLFFTLVLLSTSVITTPIPGYVPGDIVKARPKHWGDRNKTAGKHFGVVVGQNPTNDKYKVAHTSHSLPEDKYPQQEDAAKYHEKFGDAKINTGRPVEVAKEHLFPAGNQDGWHKMEDEKLAALKTQINKNCPDSRLRKRGLRCPARPN